jgi:transcriptional regulator
LKKNHKQNDWNINSVGSKFMSTMLNEIIGIKILVSKQIAKSKLSQNREKEDINNVYKELKNKGFEFLANSMKKL